MKYLLGLLAGVSLIVVLIVVLKFSSMLPIPSSVNCGKDHAAAERIRSMSREILAKLSADIQRFPDKYKTQYKQSYDTDYMLFQKDLQNLPEFQDLNAKYVRISKLRKTRAFIKLAGCFDHGINLSIDSTTATLSWGDHDSYGEETVWEK